jgi:glycerophosphodiester phosphodiesterase
MITKNIAVAKALIKAGAELEVRDGDDSTALFRAVSDSNLPFTKLFLESGANPEAIIESNDHVMYPLQIAVMDGNLKLVQMLVEAGCKVEKKYPRTFTLLQAAEHKGYTKIVSYLRDNVQLILPNQSDPKPIENSDPRPGMVRFKVTAEGKLEKIG